MHIFDVSFLGFHIAPTWYWLMYALGFIICYLFMRKVVAFRKDEIDTFLLYVFFGVIVGGRLWYILLYSPAYFFEHPAEIIAIWKWGMSFHGGFLWVILAVFLFSRVKKYAFWHIIDHLAVIIPVALGLGRIGNAINNELPGYSPYSGPFPMIINGISYFPSPLLQAFLEWIILLSIMLLWWKYLKKAPRKLSALFLIGYSTMRVIAENFRLPDEHIGYLWWTDWITLGILYTLPMFLLWIVLFTVSYQLPHHIQKDSRWE